MQITKQLCQIVQNMGVKFTLNERVIAVEEVFSETGLLPAISRRADQLCALCLGYGLGVTFDQTESSTLGVKVVFDDITPNMLRYLCILDVVSELIRVAPAGESVPLDELLYD